MIPPFFSERALKSLALAAGTLCLATLASAAPVLKERVQVTSPIVTVGDMFDNAGLLAEQALFRSPAPGTMGQVSIHSIRTAATKIGITDFENPGFASISVARSGIELDQTMLEQLVSDELRQRGVLRQGMSVSAFLNGQLSGLFAEDVPGAITLQNLRYIPSGSSFTARFILAGQPRPVDISGRLDFTIQAPHLVGSLPAGRILGPDDIEMRPLPLQFASTAGVPRLDQLIGKQLQRNMLDGAALRLQDVAEPVLIARNQIVTLYLKNGPLTLTVRGQALADAARGETVSVLNLLSNTVVQGIAANPGTVEVRATSERVASL